MTEWLSSSPAPEDPERIGADIRRVVTMIWKALASISTNCNTNRPWAEWVGPALLAKAATSAESILLLLPERRAVDASALLRVLFENVVLFSYVAIDPESRLPQMWATFYREELKAHNDWCDCGLPLMTDSDLEEVQTWLSRAWPSEDHANVRKSLDKHKLGQVPDMALHADRHWAPQFDGWHADARADEDPRAVTSSLRGLYRFIYRRGSQVTHAQHRGLDPFVTFEGRRVIVHREEDPDSLLTWNLTLVMLVFLTGPAEETVGGLSHAAARAVLATYDEPA